MDLELKLQVNISLAAVLCYKQVKDLSSSYLSDVHTSVLSITVHGQ